MDRETEVKRSASPWLAAILAAAVAFAGGGAAGSGISSTSTGERLAALETEVRTIKETLVKIERKMDR